MQAAEQAWCDALATQISDLKEQPIVWESLQRCAIRFAVSPGDLYRNPQYVLYGMAHG